MKYFILAICCLTCDDPWPIAVTDRVDVVEVNHFFDKKAKHVFDQVIFYDWDDQRRRMRIRDYKLLRHATAFPIPVDSMGTCVSFWMDQNDLRQVIGRRLRETWTQIDPENEDRKKYLGEKRLGLSHRQVK